MPKVDMRGLRKAAVLLVSLEQESAGRMLALMDRETVEAVSVEIARLGEVSGEEQAGVLEEFYALGAAGGGVARGDREHARQGHERTAACETGSRLVDGASPSIEAAPFAAVRQASPQHLLEAIAEEHPQTIALVLIHLPPQKASELLTGLAPAMQVEVVRRIADMDETQADIIREVERALENRLAATAHRRLEKRRGVSAAAEILSVTDRATEKGILHRMAEEAPELAGEIRRMRFTFEDLLKIDSRGIQALLRDVETPCWALALKGASEALQKKIFSNMSAHAAAWLKAEMADLGPVRIADVEAAQQQIVDVAHRLEDSGEIATLRRGAA